jgi:hypothetical protein
MKLIFFDTVNFLFHVRRLWNGQGELVSFFHTHVRSILEKILEEKAPFDADRVFVVWMRDSRMLHSHRNVHASGYDATKFVDRPKVQLSNSMAPMDELLDVIGLFRGEQSPCKVRSRYLESDDLIGSAIRFLTRLPSMLPHGVCRDQLSKLDIYVISNDRDMSCAMLYPQCRTVNCDGEPIVIREKNPFVYHVLRLIQGDPSKGMQTLISNTQQALMVARHLVQRGFFSGWEPGPGFRGREDEWVEIGAELLHRWENMNPFWSHYCIYLDALVHTIPRLPNALVALITEALDQLPSSKGEVDALRTAIELRRTDVESANEAVRLGQEIPEGIFYAELDRRRISLHRRLQEEQQAMDRMARFFVTPISQQRALRFDIRVY